MIFLDCFALFADIERVRGQFRPNDKPCDKMKIQQTLVTVRTKQTNRLVLTLEFTGHGCRIAAEAAAMAVLRANPDCYVVTIL